LRWPQTGSETSSRSHFVRCSLVLSSHVCLVVPSGLTCSGLAGKIECAFLISHCHYYCKCRFDFSFSLKLSVLAVLNVKISLYEKSIYFPDFLTYACESGTCLVLLVIVYFLLLCLEISYLFLWFREQFFLYYIDSITCLPLYLLSYDIGYPFIPFAK
jgi:hypothetical protein